MVKLYHNNSISILKTIVCGIFNPSMMNRVGMNTDHPYSCCTAASIVSSKSIYSSSNCTAKHLLKYSCCTYAATSAACSPHTAQLSVHTTLRTIEVIGGRNSLLLTVRYMIAIDDDLVGFS